MDNQNQKTTIRINDDYRIVVNQWDFALISKTNDGRGKYDKIIGYYPSITLALKALERNDLIGLGNLSLNDYLAELKQAERNLDMNVELLQDEINQYDHPTETKESEAKNGD